jgi:hypothetical protein
MFRYSELLGTLGWLTDLRTQFFKVCITSASLQVPLSLQTSPLNCSHFNLESGHCIAIALTYVGVQTGNPANFWILGISTQHA